MRRYTVRFHSGLSSVRGFEVEGIKARGRREAVKKVRSMASELPPVKANRTAGRGGCWSAIPQEK